MPEREKKGTAFEIPFEDAAKVCKLILGFTPTGIIYGREQAGDGWTRFVEFVDGIYGSVKMDYYWLEDHLCEVRQ